MFIAFYFLFLKIRKFIFETKMDYRAVPVVEVIRLISWSRFNYDASIEDIRACRKAKNIICRSQVSINDFIIEREFDGEIHLLFLFQK